MPKYVALLRAINVSGSRLIKMEALREIFAALKLKNVSTYIQSGNVFFDSPETDAAKLRQKIEKHLLKSLGFEVETILRTDEEIAAVIKYDAFKKMKAGEGASTYVDFLSEEPNKEKKDLITALSNEVDQYLFKGKELYIVVYKDKGKSNATNAMIERKLKLFATMRNWNTVNKLHTLLS